MTFPHLSAVIARATKGSCASLIGKTYGRLTVVGHSVRRSEVSGNRVHYCECLCRCGQKVTALRHSLIHGEKKRCGIYCALDGRTRTNMETPEYRTWISMRGRVVKHYHKRQYYYDRGITVCKRWNKFANFLADMGPRPPGTSLDRINGARGYSPANCRWATPLQQTENTSKPVFIRYRGERLSVSAWARRLGISRSGLRYRLAKYKDRNRVFVPFVCPRLAGVGEKS